MAPGSTKSSFVNSGFETSTQGINRSLVIRDIHKYATTEADSKEKESPTKTAAVKGMSKQDEQKM